MLEKRPAFQRLHRGREQVDSQQSQSTANRLHAWLWDGWSRLAIEVGAASLAIAGVVGLFYEFVERDRSRDEARLNRINVAWSQIASAQNADGYVGLKDAIETLAALKRPMNGAVFSAGDGSTPRATRNLAGLSVRGASLAGADFRGADLRNADFRDADLSGADLSNAQIADARFDGAIVSGIDLRGVDVATVDLSGAVQTTKRRTVVGEYYFRLVTDDGNQAFYDKFFESAGVCTYFIAPIIIPASKDQEDAIICNYHDWRRNRTD